MSDGERTAEVDRCDEDAAPLRAVLDNAGAKPANSTQRGRGDSRRRKTPITTVEEIEARKQA